MTNGCVEERWGRLSHLLSLIANTNRDSKRKAFKPDQFNPFAQQKKKAGGIMLNSMSGLKEYFTKDERSMS